MARRDSHRIFRPPFLRGPAPHGISTLVLVLAFCTSADNPAISEENGAKDRPPNIVLILVDDLGYGDLACYGAKDMRTPALDRFFARGVRFTQFYANCPVCSPTRASTLTGRYPGLVGVPGVIRTHADSSWGYLAEDAVLLPQLLKKAGYRTAIVGKWHLGLEEPNRPTDRGFDHFHGFLGDMMDDYYQHRRHGANYMRLGEETIDPPGHATDLFTRWACEYIESQKESDRPFFLYLAYNAPHTPIQPPDDWLAKVREQEPDMPPARARLVALIEHLDHGVGEALQALEKSGLAENTLVVFSSDNGGQVDVGADNGPLRAGKGTVYEGGVRVPAGAVWPGRIEKGFATDALFATMDIFPTICAAAGVEVSHRIDGVSFLPTLQGELQPTDDRLIFFHRREGGRPFFGMTIDAVRKGPYKLVRNDPFGPLELFDVGSDPGEQKDVLEQHPGIARELIAALQRHEQRRGAVPWQPPQRRELEPPRPAPNIRPHPARRGGEAGW